MSGNPPDLGHVLAHLAKYTGKLAEIIEHLDHPENLEKREKGLALAAAFLADSRHNGLRWCAGEAARQLREVLCPTCQAGFVDPTAAGAHLRSAPHWLDGGREFIEAVGRAKWVR